MYVWIVAVAEPLPTIDGSFRDMRCSMLAKILVSQGHRVLWWTSNFDHMRKKHRFPGPKSVEVEPGLEIRLLHGPAYSRNISLNRIRHNWAVAEAFEQEAPQEKPPDLIFICVPTLELAEKAVQYGTARGIPTIADARDPWPDLYLTVFPSVLQGLARLALATEFRRAGHIFKLATGITAVSDTYLNWALGYAERDRRATDGVFPIGYSTQSAATPVEIEERASQLLSQHNIRPEKLVITFIGTFGASYDLETVVKAAKTFQVSNMADKVQFVLAGNGDNMPRLQDMARGLENFVFTGWLDQPSMLALLGLSSVGLTAYTAHALQSLPNKPFEYMAAGLPLLSSLQGELSVLIRDEQIGLQYQAGDVNSLVEKVQWLAAHPDERKQMGIRSRQLFDDRFRSDVVYPKLVEHMERIVASSNQVHKG